MSANSDWIEHDQSGPPDLPPDTHVMLKLRDGEEGMFRPLHTVPEAIWHYWEDYPEFEVLAYKVRNDE